MDNVEVELTEAQQLSANSEMVTDLFTDMVDVTNVRKQLTLMMMLGVNDRPNEYSSDDIEDLVTTLHYLEDIE